MSSRTDVEGAFAAQNVIASTLQRVLSDVGIGTPEGTGVSGALVQVQQAALALQKVALRLAIAEVNSQIVVDQTLKTALQQQLAALP